jgi:hypothetical protein
MLISLIRAAISGSSSKWTTRRSGRADSLRERVHEQVMPAPAHHKQDAPAAAALSGQGVALLTNEEPQADSIRSWDERRTGAREEEEHRRARGRAHPQPSGTRHEPGQTLQHRGTAQQHQLVRLRLVQHAVDDTEPLHHFKPELTSRAHRE